jgi:hypothetical protein
MIDSTGPKISSRAIVMSLRTLLNSRGNVDTGQWAEHYPEAQKVTLGSRCIYVLPDIQTLQLDPVSSGVDAA